MVSDAEVEIQTLRFSQPPVLQVPPTLPTDTTEMLSDFHLLAYDFFKERVFPRIEALEQERQRLAATYNALLPIHRLSEEALTKIFLFATLESVDARGSWLQCHLPLKSVILSHVCQIWRNLAVACPQLWSTVHLSYPQLSVVHLSRRMDSPITVIWEGASQGREHKQHSLLLQILSQDVDRIRHFVSQCQVPPLETAMGWAHPHKPDASALETLIVYNPGEGHREFLRQGFPSLRHLDINRFHLSWSYLPLSATLTHLEIRSESGRNRARASTFLKSLVNLWSLQSLHLSENLPDLSLLPDNTPPFPLPSLRFLSLMDSVGYIADFLSLVRTYVAADAHIYCIGRDENEGGQPLTTLTRLTDKIFASTRNVYGAERNVETLRLFSTGVDVNYHSEEGDPPAHPKLTIADDCSGNTAFELLDILMSHINFSTMTSLVIDEESELPFETPWLFLGRLPKLETITMHHILDLDLIEVLEGELNDVSFPALIALEFVEIDEDYELDMEECTCRLVRMLEKRRSAGFPLSVLRIEESACFEDEHIEKIRQVDASLVVLWDECHICVDQCPSCEDPDIVERYARLEI